MNVVLDSLLLEHQISEKDCHHVRQMFTMLPNNKRQYILDNFVSIAKKIKKIEQNTITEQEILLDSIMPEITKITQK